MAINLESLSLTSAFNSIVTYFRSQENNSKWRDLSNGSEGSFIIRMLANVMSTLSYRIVAQSRENYLSTASLVSSCEGISVNLGYSVFRGSNLKRRIRLTPNANYTLPKFSVIGTYSQDYTILTLEDIELQAGVPKDIDTVVGNLREESFTAGTSDTRIFSLFTTGISEDFVLFKDADEVPTTKVMREMIEDKYLVRTNPYSSVDIAYLNDIDSINKVAFKYKYGTGTEFTIRYVELADVPVVPFASSMFTYGTLEDYSTISLYQPPESVDSIKLRAPLDHDVQNLIRSKVDYANRVEEIIPAISEINWSAITPTYTQVTYLKNNFTLLTGTTLKVGSSEDNLEVISGTEVDKINGILRNENYFGTPIPDITVPRREVADLKIEMALKNKYKSISDINLDIENILKNYYDSYLAVTFNTYELERLVEELSYVKYARVHLNINERTNNTNYQLGYLVEKDNKYYKVSKILGSTAETEPANGWPAPLVDDIDTQAVIQDGTIYWKCYKRLPNMPYLSISRREPSASYGLGDFMYVSSNPNYMYKCIDLVKNSGGVAPDLSDVEYGDFIEDGGIIWVVRDKLSDAPTWNSFTQYRLGQTVNVNGSDVSLECVSYTGATGTNENIEFEKREYAVVSKPEPLVSATNVFCVSGDQRYYFKADDAITAKYSEGITNFVILSSVYSPDIYGDVTVITVTRYQNGDEPAVDPTKDYSVLYPLERGTKDGGILWTLVDDVNNVKYDWNSYVTFKHTLEIIEG